MRAGILNHIASLVCHQIDTRSISMGDEFLPLCARCTGIYSGFLVAVLSQVLTGATKFARLLTLKRVLFSMIPLFALIAESIGEEIQLWECSNTERLHFGFIGGLGMGILLLPLCGYFLGQRPPPVATGAIRQWPVFTVLASGVLALQWFPVLLPILAIVSVLGLLLIYLFLNLAISGAVLGLKGGNYSPTTIIILFGLTLALFAGEWALFSLFKSQQ